MQEKVDFNLLGYVKRYWFQLSLVLIVLYVLASKDLSFQFNINDPEIENSTDHPGKAQHHKKKEKDLITAKQSNPKIAKSEAGLFSKIPFIGGGSSSSKKSELPKVEEYIIQAYIKRFAHVAISERKKYGVPSSVILANALFHSYAGKRDMSLSGNNHFGIPCTDDWNGAQGTYAGNCYRHYENAWTSFRDHSLFVTSGSYSKMRQLSSTDYKGWAKGLEKAGFSEFKDLEDNLIELIENFELHRLDFQ